MNNDQDFNNAGKSETKGGDPFYDTRLQWDGPLKQLDKGMGKGVTRVFAAASSAARHIGRIIGFTPPKV